MGSPMKITIFVCIYLISTCLMNKILADPGQLHEERREYQFQRSSKILGTSMGGSGYYNSESGNYDNMNSDLDTWSRTNRDQVEGMAEKLKEQFNSAVHGGSNGGESHGYYRSSSYSTSGIDGSGCNTGCALLASQTGKTQEELDQIARDMTNQIIIDIQSGKLHRSEINQPNWFEQRVAEKIESLNKQYQSQSPSSYTNRYYQTSSSQQQQQQQQQQQRQQQQHHHHTSGYYRGGSNIYESSDVENLQQQHQNIFDMDDEDLTQIQQNVFDQRQQQGSSVHQEQSQQQHNTYGYVYPTQHTMTHSTNVQEETTRRRQHQQQIPITYPSSSTSSSSKHSIYSHLEGDSEVMPNYRPRVVLNQDTDFEILDHTKETERRPRPAVTTTHKDEKHETTEQHRQYHQYRPVMTDNRETEQEEYDGQVQQHFDYQHPQQHGLTQHFVTDIDQEDTQHYYTPKLPSFSLHHKTEKTDNGHTVQSNVMSVYTSSYNNLHKLSIEEYRKRLQIVKDQLISLGYKHLTDNEYNATIASGGFTHNGYKYTYNVDTQHYEKGERIDISEADYLEVLKRFQNQLRMLGYQDMTQQEYNQTLTSGIFIRGGNKWSYNTESGQFEKNQLTEDEYKNVLRKLQEQFRRLGIEQTTMTQQEYNETITTGVFYHGGHKWLYDANTGRYEEKEISTDEYQKILHKLQQQLYRYGFEQLQEREYNEIIRTGFIVKGGNKWKYNIQTGNLEKIEITEQEYLNLLHRLQNQLNQLGIRDQMSIDEYNRTINSGQFIYGGHKFIFDTKTGRYEQIELTENEFQNIQRKLQDQLRMYGLTGMDQRELNKTISTGVFYRGNTKWKYNIQTGNLEKIEITEQEYLNLLHRLQNQLNQLGIRDQMSIDEYNRTINSGQFIYGGHKFIFDTKTGRYEQIELTENEFQNIQRKLQDQLRMYGLTGMDQREYNKTISTGVFYRGNTKWKYNTQTGTIEKIQLTDNDYQMILYKLQEQLRRLGFKEMSANEYNETIHTGTFIRGGTKWGYNAETERYEKLEITGDEYRDIYHRIQMELSRLGFNQLTEQQYNQTITTGIFVQGANKWHYNYATGAFDKEEITIDEYNVILEKIRNTLQSLGYRQMSDREYNETIATGKFVRDGYQWEFNFETGQAHKIRVAGQYEEMNVSEYNEIYRRLQETLRKLGYNKMTDAECRSSITSGLFIRGGNHYQYNPNNGEFQRIELTAEEYLKRYNILLQEFNRIGFKKQLTDQEYRDIINKGYFYNGGYRYEYNLISGRFERIEITEEEYQQRLQRLREQLRQIGYGEMSERDCHKAITTGIFHYGGFEWVYNFDTGYYRMGDRSTVEEQIINGGGGGGGSNNANKDSTIYNTTKQEETTTKQIPTRPPRPTRPHYKPSGNRGDQPPQHIEADYESEETLEVEPGIGFYGVTKKPEIGLAPRTPPPRRISTNYPLFTAPLAPFETTSNKKLTTSYEGHHQQTIVSPAPQEYQRNYHRTQTSYSRTTTGELPPLQYASEHTLTNEFNEEVDPFNNPPVVSTQAYIVGDKNERSTTTQYGGNRYRGGSSSSTTASGGSTSGTDITAGSTRGSSTSGNRYNQSGTSGTATSAMPPPPSVDAAIDASLETPGHQTLNMNAGQHQQHQQHGQNSSYSRGGSWSTSTSYKHDKHGTIEDMGQKYEDIQFPQEDEDLTQQFVDFGQESEDLTQQQQELIAGQEQEDLTQQLVDIGQETQKHQYQQQSSSHGYHSRPHSSRYSPENGNYRNSAPEEEIITANVQEVKQKAPTEEEKPGFWQRFKDKTKQIIG